MPVLPQYQDDSLAFQLMQNQWGAILNPIINNALNQGILLTGIKLATGKNTINHTLGQKLQGWMICRQDAAATFYDFQTTNPIPDKTLILNSSAPVNVSMVVF